MSVCLDTAEQGPSFALLVAASVVGWMVAWGGLCAVAVVAIRYRARLRDWLDNLGRE